MKVIDDFLPSGNIREIYQVMMGGTFPWHYNPTIDYEGQVTDKFQFTHSVMNPERGERSEAFGLLYPIIGELNVKHLLRVKANLNVRGDGKNIGEYHNDVTVPTAKTAIYYVNTNNGGTEFANGKRVDSVENRIVIFDSSLKHRGVSCTDEKTRVVVNINYIPYEVRTDR